MPNDRIDEKDAELTMPLNKLKNTMEKPIKAKEGASSQEQKVLKMQRRALWKRNKSTHKGRLRAAISISAEKVHVILMCYFGEALRCAVSAENKMVARIRPLSTHRIQIANLQMQNIKKQYYLVDIQVIQNY